MEDILLVHRKSNRNFPEVLLDSSAIWQTCLRKIIFCTEADFSVHSEHLDEEDQVLRGENALSFLLEVLCGLHSPIVGETEVFGQFRAFIESRRQAEDPLFTEHQKWLQFVTAEVKRTRAEHLVGLGSQSYGSLLRRHAKDLNHVTLCGSGQLAQEILPWLAHKKSLQVICRDPGKLQNFSGKYNNLTVTTYNDSYVHGEAMVIAAPLTDTRILELLQKNEARPQTIFDLRGEENKLSTLVASQFPPVSVVSLNQFFAEIEETKKETQIKIQALKDSLYQKSVDFMQRTELRPLGWDDICA